MAYATQQDMIDRFAEDELIQLTDRHNTGAVDVAILNQALADADARIDGYLQGRYTLPLSPVPLTLKRLACDIARYFLYDNRATEQVSKGYDDAVGFLKKVASGEISLGVDAAQAQPAAGGGPQIDAPDRVFSGGNLSDYNA